jgi:hypothetical protein
VIIEDDRRRWFAPQRVGYGWRPVTWQGWAITLLPLLVVVLVALVH